MNNEQLSFANELDNTDKRYNKPKGHHGFPTHEIDMTIEENDIYRTLRDAMLNAQRSQVGYGMAKYPETLNKDSWDTIETIDHIIEESVDRLHYMIMLKQKLQANVCSDPSALDLGKDWVSEDTLVVEKY